MERVYYSLIELTIGEIWAARTENGLIQVSTLTSRGVFMDRLHRTMDAELIQAPEMFDDLRGMLEEWQNGEKIAFDLPFNLRGTPFQRDVWKAIHKIPYGRLSSYGVLAKDIGRPRAARAVGNAVGSNPCGIVIPCHRVIHSDGSLGGFGHGFEERNLDVKRLYLSIEGILTRVENYPEREVDLTQFF
jgi:methylated-DNA-[protein]-cysteine S-methyltransferase